ncbi:hypothetical protein D3C76_1753180 [compost metagenome]
MRLINDDEVVISPVQGFEIDLAGAALRARQVGMVQDVIIEAVLRKQVALVVDGVDRPVIP